MLFASVVIIFAPLGFVVVFIEELELDFNSFLGKVLRKKVVSYSLGVFIGVILVPFYVVFGPFALTFYTIYKYFDEILDTQFYICFLTIVFGIIGTPIMLVILVLGTVGGHLLGIIYLTIKIYIITRRCFNPQYLTPKISYGII